MERLLCGEDVRAGAVGLLDRMHPQSHLFLERDDSSVFNRPERRRAAAEAVWSWRCRCISQEPS